MIKNVLVSTSCDVLFTVETLRYMCGHKRWYVPTLKLNLIHKKLLEKLITGLHWLCSTQVEHFVRFQIDDKLSLEEFEIAGVEHATRQQARHVYRIDVSMFLLICVSYHL